MKKIMMWLVCASVMLVPALTYAAPKDSDNDEWRVIAYALRSLISNYDADSYRVKEVLGETDAAKQPSGYIVDALNLLIKQYILRLYKSITFESESGFSRMQALQTYTNLVKLLQAAFAAKTEADFKKVKDDLAKLYDEKTGLIGAKQQKEIEESTTISWQKRYAQRILLAWAMLLVAYIDRKLKAADDKTKQAADQAKAQQWGAPSWQGGAVVVMLPNPWMNYTAMAAQQALMYPVAPQSASAAPAYAPPVVRF